MKQSLQDALTCYRNLVTSAANSFDKGKFPKSLSAIIAASSWMYRFNIIYSDIELEDILHKIADESISKKNILSPQYDNVVFIDNFGFDNRGLTQQYLRGLMRLNKNILYILHNYQPNENSEIIRELKEYGKAKIVVYKTTNKNYCEIASFISEEIYDFSPKDIFIHIAPWDVVTLLAISSIKGATKYNVNLTDHAFWLGTTFVDYNIEFRGYGEQLSLQKRHFTKSQLIRVPFYPVVSRYASFQGFPQLPEDRIIVFCGGAEYKMLGKDGIFFKLMDIILDISEMVFILVAGIKENSAFAKYVSQMRHNDRVYFIGTRTDINDVFAHSDIYLSSYPLTGGLMTQYAAYNHLPIIAYAEPEDVGRDESMVNHFHQAMNSKESLTEFRKYAKKLINSKEFRKSEGEANYNAMMNEEKFGYNLGKVLSDHKTDIDFIPEQPQYEDRIKYYLEIENKTHEALETLVSQMKYRSLFIFKDHTGLILWTMMKKIINKLFSTLCQGLNKR